MTHKLTLITNGNRRATINATVECSCGVIVPLESFELFGDVTEEANDAILKHAVKDDPAINWEESYPVDAPVGFDRIDLR